MGVYTHIGLHDQSAAIELLPAPPEIKKSRKGSANGKVNGSSSAVPDLGAAWAKLPEKVRAEIVAMVNEAASTPDTVKQPELTRSGWQQGSMPG